MADPHLAAKAAKPLKVSRRADGLAEDLPRMDLSISAVALPTLRSRVALLRLRARQPPAATAELAVAVPRYGRRPRPGCSHQTVAGPLAFSLGPRSESNPLDRSCSKVVRWIRVEVEGIGPMCCSAGGGGRRRGHPGTIRREPRSASSIASGGQTPTGNPGGKWKSDGGAFRSPSAWFAL